jgi:hypothetical protein
VALTNELRVIFLGCNRGDCTLLDLTIVFGIFGMIQTNLKKTPKPLPVETNTSCRLLCCDVATKPAGIHMLRCISEVVAARIQGHVVSNEKSLIR